VCDAEARCVPPAQCVTDADCAPLLCDEARQRCEACVEDGDCPGQQVCQRGEGADRNRCAEPAECLGDEDCLGTRTCQEGLCLPTQACEDDRLAGNDSPARAAGVDPGTHTELVRCDRIDDWFSARLRAGEGLQVELRFDPSVDLALALFAADDPFVPLDESDGALGTERVVLGAAQADGDVLLRVSGGPGQQGPYELQVTVVSGFCAPDRLEAGGGNDRPDTATPVAGGGVELAGLRICPGDEDWFALQAERVSGLAVELQGEAARLELSLRSADGAEEVAAGVVEGDSHTLRVAELAPGAYRLRVAGQAEPLGLEYTLRTDLRAALAELQFRCDAAPVLPFEQVMVGDTRRATADFSQGCADLQPDAAPEELYRIELQQPASVRASLPQAGFDAVLSLRADCMDPASEVACAVAPPGTLFVAEAEAGVYTLMVDGVGASAGTYELLVETGVPGPVAGDDCAEPLVLPLDEGEATVVQGDTRPASPSFGAQGCVGGQAAAGRDLVYVFDVPQAGRLSATLDAPTFQGLLVLAADGCGGDELRCSAEGSLDGVAVQAGPHALVVDGSGALQAGPFGLTLRFEPLPAPPANDTCAGALSVTPAEVPGRNTVAGDTSAATPTYDSQCDQGEERAGGADVVYHLRVDEPAALQASLRSEVELLLRLEAGPCGSGGAPLACSTREGALVAGELAPGDYYLIVDGRRADRAGPFELEVALEPAATACAGAVELADGEPLLGDSADGPRLDAGGCGGAEGPEVAHRFTLQEPASARLSVLAEFAATLYVRSDCAAPASELDCTADSPLLELPLLQPGTYWVFVDTDSRRGGEYQLSLALGPPEVGPPNDLCAAAEPLMVEVDGGPVEIAGSSAGARSEHDSACPVGGATADGPDVVYAFSLDRDAEVTLALLPEFVGVVALLSGPCARAEELGCAAADPGEPARLQQWLSAGDYLVVVSGSAGGQEGPFGLSVQAVAGAGDGACEQAGPLVAGAPLPGDNAAGSDRMHATCTAEQLWDQPESAYRLHLDAPASLRVRLLNNAHPGSLSLRNRCGAAASEIACAAGPDLSVDAVPAGDVWLVVDGFVAPGGGQSPYELLATLGPPLGPPPGDTCAEPLPVAVDDHGLGSESGALVGAGDDHVLGCGGPGGPELVYVLTLEQEGRITAWAQAGFATTLALRGEDCDAGDELACGPRIESGRLPAGSYHLFVEGPPGEAGPVTVNVLQEAAPGNEGCAQAEPLVFVDDVALATGDLGRAVPDSQAAGCGLAATTEAGADLVYALELPEPARLQVEVRAGFEAGLYLRGEPCLSALERACGRGTLRVDEPLAAGTWFLFVDEQGDGAGGPFELSVLRSVVRPPPNDRCADATPLPVLASGARLRLDGVLRDALDDHQPGGPVCPVEMGAGPDVVFHLHLPDAMQMRLVPPVDPDMLVYLRAECASEPLLGCLPAERPLVPAGQSRLFVDRAGPAHGDGAFSLLVDVYPPPANGTCATATELSLEGGQETSVEGHTAFAPDSLAGPGCGVAGAGDVFYAFELEDTSDLTVSLQADFDATISLLGAGCDEAPLVCGAPAELVGLPAGRYHLAVDGAQADREGSFVLGLLAQATEPPANDLCADAEPIPVPAGGGTVAVTGRLAGAQDDLQPDEGCGEVAPGGGVDVVYAFELNEPMGVDVLLAAAFEPTAYLLQGCDAVEAAQCWPGSTPLLPPGEYRLVVDSAGPLPPTARFDLSLTFVPAPTNLACAAPEALVLDADGRASASGDTRWAADLLAAPGCGGGGANELQYTLQLDEPSDLLVEVDAPFLSSLEVYRGGCDAELVACGPPRELPGLLPGLYHLTIDGAGPGEQGPFDLRVSARPARARSLTDKCATAGRLQLRGRGVAVLGNTLGEDGVHTTEACPAGAGSGASPESVLLFSLDRVAPLTLEVIDSDRPLVATLRQAPCQGGVELACGGGALPWQDLLVPAGDYALILDGSDPEGPGAFAAELSLGELPDPKCEDAPVVSLVDGVAELAGTTEGASALFAPTTCADPGQAQDSPEAVYALHADRPVSVSVEVLQADAPAVVYLLRGPCSEARELACGVGATPLSAVPVEPGWIYLVVDGAAAAGVGGYRLRVEVTPLGTTCTQPRVVEVPAGGGTLELVGDRAGGGLSLHDPGCPGDSSGPEEIWALDLPEPLSLVATTRSDTPTTLRLLSGCEPPATLACQGPDVPLVAARLEAGRHLLVVDGPAPGAPYRAEVTLSPLPQRCAQADMLQPGVSVAGSTVGVGDLLGGRCGGEGAGEAVHPFHLDVPQRVTLELEEADFAASLTLLDGCYPLALELDCGDGSGRIVQPRLPPGDYVAVVDGLDGAEGSYLLRMDTAPAAIPVGGETCADRYRLQPDPATGELALVGTTEGRADSFDTNAFCGVAGDGPDTAFQLTMERTLDMEAVLHTHGFAATWYLLLPDCHDGRAAAPWPFELGLVRRFEEVAQRERMIVGTITEGDYTLVIDAADTQAGGDFSLELALLEQGCTWAPFLLLGEVALGSTVDGLDRFSDGCGAPLGPAPEGLHRFALDAPARVTFEVEQADFDPVLSVRDRCYAPAQPLACERGSTLSVDLLEPGTYTVVVDSLDGTSGEYQLRATAE